MLKNSRHVVARLRHVVGFKQSVSFKEILRVAMFIFWNTRATSWASLPRRELSVYREFIIFLSFKPPMFHILALLVPLFENPLYWLKITI